MIWGPRHDLAVKRLRSVLRAHMVASDRILEQKISDAGPTNQRIDPHILTEARTSLLMRGIIKAVQQSNTPWYHLADANPEAVSERLEALDELHRKTQKRQFTLLLGQMLEIAVFRALGSQTLLEYFGHFRDLDSHGDSKLYSKEEPPSSLSGREIPSGKKLDFLVRHPQHGYAGIEVKNVRQWMYPDRDEIRAMLFKCCSQDVVPVLISRRIHYSTFSVLNPCGVILHQSFNQLYPKAFQTLADQVKDKHLLGYHDVRVGSEPDARLIRFIHQHLPQVLPTARQGFDRFKDLLWSYANLEHSYKSFAARVKRRLRGEPEDLPEFEGPETPESPEGFEELDEPTEY